MVTDTWAVTRRYLDPYGNLLANKAGAPAPGTLPGSHGYLNQPENKVTGFTELGARFYDPTVGRFTSVDPVLADTDPTAAHGYTYSGNNPIGYADASGLMLLDSPGGGGGPGHPTPSYVWTPPSHNPNWMYQPRNDSGNSSRSSGGGGGCFQCGLIAGAGDGARDVIDSFNPVSIANNIKKLIADPPDVKTFFKSIVTSFTHADDFKAAYDAWKSGDEYAFGKAVGKLVVELSADLAGLLLGGTKAVTGITRALKGATASKKLDGGGSGGGGASCALRSFAGDTRVVMADGSLKRIDQVHIGDKVKTRNPVTGQTSTHPVTATWVHSDVLVAATFTAVHHEGQSSGRHGRASDERQRPAAEIGRGDGGGQVRIATTDDHPYWNATSGEYQELRLFKIGDRVSTRDQTLVYAGMDSTSENAVAYNLTVAGPHTYLVEEAWTLVHNCGDGSTPEGIVYSRKDLVGESSYVGQAKSESRYLKRQAEHARANPDSDFEFDILGRAEPGDDLDRMEEHFIRQGGGPTNKGNPNGGLANRRHQMNDTRYQEAGGDL